MGPLILLVDDDEYAVEILEEWLKGEGYRIITALEGEEALRLLEDHSPELILSDYVMPGMDGIAFLTRAKEVCPNAVRLITTGYGDLDMAIEAINDAGVYKFIPKPWNRNDLRLTVRRALEHQALLREMFECEKLVSLGRLAAGVAHEITNPVSFIKSNLEILADYVREIGKATEGFRRVVRAFETSGQVPAEVLQEAADLFRSEDLEFVMGDLDSLTEDTKQGTCRIQQIIHPLLSFSHKDEAWPVSVDVNAALRDVTKLVQPEVRECRLNSSFREVPTVRGFNGQLQQVFTNLLINAAHAVSRGGEITLETFTRNGDVVIRVSDTGVGISQEDLSEIFTPYFTTKPVGVGTGLGLAISKAILENHSGSIEVESEVGEGTTFTICLPAETKAPRLDPVDNPDTGHSPVSVTELGDARNPIRTPACP